MTTGTNAANLYYYYSKKLLTTLYETLQLYPLGMKTTLPAGMGKQVKWLRYSKLNAATTALIESIPPSESNITSSNVTADISQYGAFVRISDLLETTAIDDVVESALTVLSKQGSLTFDTIIRTELDTFMPNQFANNKASLATVGSSDVLTAKEFLKAAITLKKELGWSSYWQ